MTTPKLTRPRFDKGIPRPSDDSVLLRLPANPNRPERRRVAAVTRRNRGKLPIVGGAQ